jgi:hypothetical protein
MIAMEWALDILLVGLLTATLFHAVRLERALGAMKRDRAALDNLVASFLASTQAAESGIERLHAATDGSGQQIQHQIDAAATLKDDLTFLVQRGEGLADRIEDCVRAARPVVATSGPSPQAARATWSPQIVPTQMVPPAMEPSPEVAAMERPARQAEPKLRSQAERDLLKALRMVR